MSEADGHKLWNELSRSFIALQPSLAREIGQRDAAEIERFASHNEFGVALEHLVATLAEEKIAPSDHLREEIARIAGLMSFELKD